jgi:hypothetical protein
LPLIVLNAQHIHGSASGHDFMCPTKSADVDGDGFVNTEEGLPAYGDIFVSLTTQGDTTKTSGLAVDRMPTANAEGVLSYERTIEASALPAGTIEHLKDLHVVQHGIDANDNGAYDMEALGESTFAQSLGVDGIPEEATNPATCGMVAGAAPGWRATSACRSWSATGAWPAAARFPAPAVRGRWTPEASRNSRCTGGGAPTPPPTSRQCATTQTRSATSTGPHPATT